MALLGLATVSLAIEEVSITARGVVYDLDTYSSKLHASIVISSTFLSSDDPLYLIFYPESYVTFTLKAGSKGNERLVCSSVGSAVCIIDLKTERESLEDISGYRFSFGLDCDGNVCKGKVGVSVSNHIYISEGAKANIFLSHISELRAQMEVKPSSESTKFRIDAIGTSISHSIDSSTLQGYANLITDGWPTSQKRDFELRHVHGNEVAHVAYIKDKSFCKQSTCIYKFTFNTTNLYKLQVRTHLSAAVEKISLDSNIVVLSHVV